MTGTGLPPELQQIDFFPIIKGALVGFLVLYLILAMMVIKQIGLMTQTIKSIANGFLFMLAYLHFGIVLLTLLFAIFAL